MNDLVVFPQTVWTWCLDSDVGQNIRTLIAKMGKFWGFFRLDLWMIELFCISDNSKRWIVLSYKLSVWKEVHRNVREHIPTQKTVTPGSIDVFYWFELLWWNPKLQPKAVILSLRRFTRQRAIKVFIVVSTPFLNPPLAAARLRSICTLYDSFSI